MTSQLVARDAGSVPELAGRLYIPKLYRVEKERGRLIALLEHAVEASGGRVVYSSFREQRTAPVYLGAEDGDGRRYGMLIYPFTTTKRPTRNRPMDEHRAQIRFGDPVRSRDERNLIAHDVAGVDVTLVLAVDPERGFMVGLDPLVYEDLPMGISVYYRDRHVGSAAEHGWAVWERTKKGGTRRQSWEGLETLVGFGPTAFSTTSDSRPRRPPSVLILACVPRWLKLSPPRLDAMTLRRFSVSTQRRFSTSWRRTFDLASQCGEESPSITCEWSWRAIRPLSPCGPSTRTDSQTSRSS